MKESATLPSWNDGPAKTAILEFVRSVTTPGDSFVPPAERIAAFDNDGTLWCEKPIYIQADFIFRRFKEMVREDPAWAREQPYKALVENDIEWLRDIYAHVPEVLKGVTEAFAGSPLKRLTPPRGSSLRRPLTRRWVCPTRRSRIGPCAN